MADIGYDSTKQGLFSQLTTEVSSKTRTTLFTYNYQAINFAAMVGCNTYEKLGSHRLKNRSNLIPQRIFQNKIEENYVYALALTEFETPDMFRQEKEAECWKLYESYADLGLDEIELWVKQGAEEGQHELIEILLSKMQEVALEIVNNENDLKGTLTVKATGKFVGNYV